MKTPRYCKKPFPPYRYIPGKLPHPEIHPDGHSYGEIAEPAPKLPPEAWAKNELYLFGVDLFNHGYWWEAHEAWERCWLITQKFDLPGQFLQGLIQFSAALLKLYGGSLRGFEKLYGEATKRLRHCQKELGQETHFMGLDLSAWLENAKNFHDAQIKKDSKQFTPQSIDPLEEAGYPYLTLEKSK